MDTSGTCASLLSLECGGSEPFLEQVVALSLAVREEGLGATSEPSIVSEEWSDFFVLWSFRLRDQMWSKSHAEGGG